MNSFDEMVWLHEPRWGLDGGVLWVETQPGTDCWQRTHYGFQHDNAHALVRSVGPEFLLRARFRFKPNAQYDQCGLYVRADSACWFKCSVEFEPNGDSRLGSVVTNHGYSDWATQDIPSSTEEMTFEVRVGANDLTAKCSCDGMFWHQMRIAHLSATGPLMAGIYGCSPVGQGFRFEVEDFRLTESA